MEKRKYKVSVFDQDFYFVSDDPESVVTGVISDLESNLNKTFKGIKDNSSSVKIQILLLNLVQQYVDVSLLHKELDEFRQKEKSLLAFLESVSSVTQV